jgi:hypothetical protein
MGAAKFLALRSVRYRDFAGSRRKDHRKPFAKPRSGVSRIATQATLQIAAARDALSHGGIYTSICNADANTTGS